MLLHHAHVVDGHAAVHGLAHVVDGEQGHLHGGEGFHLDAGGADGFHRCGTKYAWTKWGQTPINLSALHNQIGVTGPKFGKDGAFSSITAVACNGPCMLQCYM